MKVTELARRMYLNPTTMVGILDRLEAKNLVTRARSEKDRRVVHISLTDQGRELVRNTPEVVQSLLEKGLEELPAEKLNNISIEMEEIIRILSVQEA